jgi:hypothetical protein
VRLGTWIPFAQAVDASRFFIGLQVSEPTVCRLTGASEGAYMAVQAAPVEAIAQTLPETPAGPAVHLLGVDRAMLPLEGTAAFAPWFATPGQVESGGQPKPSGAGQRGRWSRCGRVWAVWRNGDPCSNRCAPTCGATRWKVAAGKVPTH